MTADMLFAAVRFAMIDASFDTNFNLKLQLQAAQRQLAAFRSGDQYVRIAESYEKRLSLYHRLVKKQRSEIGEYSVLKIPHFRTSGTASPRQGYRLSAK